MAEKQDCTEWRDGSKKPTEYKIGFDRLHPEDY